MKVLVTGGSGFVGSHVVDALSAAGHDVTVYDLQPSPFLKPNQRFVQGDILNVGSLEKVFQGQDAVYNFAGLADINEAADRPLDTVQLNLLGTVNQLEAARKAGVKRFIFASTIYVYSDAGGFYRASKQASELYIEEYQRHYQLDYTILRFGTLYGPRADARNSVYRYLKQALSENKITAQGTGDELREYIHVEDAARLAVQVLGEDFKNQNVIITGHHPLRYRDLLLMVREIIGTKTDIHWQTAEDPKSGSHYSLTPYHYQPKLAKKLVSSYYVDMGQGLLQCLAELHDHLGSESKHS